MKLKISSLTGLLVMCMASLMVSSAGTAKIGQFPDAPFVAVKDIDPNWVEISIVGGVRSSDGSAEWWDEEKHSTQAIDLADFVCNLYNRTAVMLSLFGGPLSHNIHGKPMRTPHLIMKNSYYLFACAIE